jgi:hypothetical protein
MDDNLARNLVNWLVGWVIWRSTAHVVRHSSDAALSAFWKRSAVEYGIDSTSDVLLRIWTVGEFKRRRESIERFFLSAQDEFDHFIGLFAMRAMSSFVRKAQYSSQSSSRGERCGGRGVHLLWAAGVAPPAAHWLEAMAHRAEQLKAQPDLTLPGHRENFVLGKPRMAPTTGENCYQHSTAASRIRVSYDGNCLATLYTKPQHC